MDRFLAYISESYDELINKVTWPTWANLLETTKIVLVAAFIFAFITFLLDGAFSQTLQAIYRLAG